MASRHLSAIGSSGISRPNGERLRLPVISVDTKKKELIGNFRQAGRSWRKTAIEVNQYDFTSQAECRAVPYGIYDLAMNKGHVYVGTSGDTPEFATDAIAAWWRDDGCRAYPEAKEILILADGGGSNAWRSRGWKWSLQTKVADAFGLRVTVCHYPTRCSKWNPVEYRLFSHISMNWAGVPLQSLDVMLGSIRGTTSATGLSVKATLLKGEYLTARKVTQKELDHLRLHPHSVCPNWNYTLEPHKLEQVEQYRLAPTDSAFEDRP
jgi:Rhodopirellula transposase DDE domain